MHKKASGSELPGRLDLYDFQARWSQLTSCKQPKGQNLSAYPLRNYTPRFVRSMASAPLAYILAIATSWM